jgi:hypothetical protein
MDNTAGANSGPTQANLQEIADEICGPNSCPDRCCCGNGKVDKNKGEGCDPKAKPVGCGVGETCCAVCCNCYGPICIPGDGEYISQASCQERCGSDSTCYKNYQTGCWDCVKSVVVVHETCYDPSNIRGNEECEHTARSFVEQGAGFYENDLAGVPVLGGMFANEKINIQTEEGDTGYLSTEDGSITDMGDGLLDTPTVTLYTDQETLGLVSAEEMSAQQALSEGRIRIEGYGLIDGIRFGFFHFVFDMYNFLSPPEELVVPEELFEFPQEYFDEMEEVFGAEPAPDDPEPGILGELPDGGYFGEDVFPE